MSRRRLGLVLYAAGLGFLSATGWRLHGVALVLAVLAWCRAGARALVLAAVLAAVVTPAASAVLLLLEHRYGYFTI